MESEIAGRRITVTGGAGFLGSFVVDRLQELGATVFAPRSRDYDLTRAEDADRLFTDTAPEVVIHLAARVGGIEANRMNPGAFFHDNITMGVHVIETARRHDVKKVVLVGTTCSYPAGAPVPFREDTLWDGYPEETNAPYGVAKRVLITMLQAYRRQYGLHGIALIPANLYGPRDNFDLRTGHVVPALIRKFSEAKERGDAEVVVWGTGTASREFVYVADAAEAIVLAAARYDSPEPVNIGTGEEVLIRDLAGLIGRLVGFEGAVRWNPDRPDGQLRRCLDISRARAAFGFTARTSLAEGLTKTLAWYQAMIRSHAVR